jgi:pilus assembly protein CpaC
MNLRALRPLLLLLAALAAAAPAAAQRPTRELVVEMNAGEMIRLPSPASSVFVANPEIADIQAPTPETLIVFGRRPGRTSVYALSAQGQTLAAVSVRVTHDLADLRQLLSAQVPDAAVTVSSTPQGIVVSGSAPSPAQANRVRELARKFAVNEREDILDNMTIVGSTQVNLRIRVAEVTRQAIKRLGFSWGAILSNGTFALGILTGRAFPIAAATAATGGAGALIPGAIAAISQAPQFGQGSEVPSTAFGGVQQSNSSINAVLDLLANEGLVTILAEPNITAISGEQSSFLAGGEFPIPVAQQNNTISVEFKRFGISVEFNPTVLSRDRISMRVRPEVSELSDRGAVTIGGLRIPGLSVRRAETTIELGSGQSFAMAGLFSNNMNTEVSRTPGLGDLPMIGALFRS